MKRLIARVGIERTLVVAFVLALVAGSAAAGLPVPVLVGDTLKRVAMNAVLVLSLIPMLRAGLGINYGMPLSVMPGLLGMVLALELRLTGPLGLAVALVAALLIALPVGRGYAALLKVTAGNEEVVGTFTGFSAVYLMAILWGVAPFTNRAMLWPIAGYGLRPQTNLAGWFGHVLDTTGAFTVAGMRVPTGTLLVVLGVAGIVALWLRTRHGVETTIASEEPAFAAAAGVPLARRRTVAVIASTALAAVGIVLYAHTYGFLQLYSAPLMLAYPAAAAVLIGGYSAGGRVSVLDALLGALLFNAILVFSSPLANAVLLPEMSDLVRVLVTNGVLLYALVRGGRGRRSAT